MISRRSFFQYSTAGVAAVLAEAAPFLLRSDPEISLTELEIFVPGLPAAFSGFRIGFASDFHLGAFVPHHWLQEAVSLLRRSEIDLLLFGGDYIGYRDTIKSRKHGFTRVPAFDKVPRERLAPLLFSQALSALQSGKLAVPAAGVLGNHDYRVRKSERLALARAGGLRILVNDWIEIRRGAAKLRVVGLDDERYGAPRLPALLPVKSRDEVRIVLAHNPDTISRVLRTTQFIFDLGLAGHTHGGQIKLPLLGALQYNVQDLTFREGLNVFASTPVYTTRGVGLVKVPCRVNCPAEVAVLTLI